MGQVMDPKVFLHNTAENNYHALTKSFHDHKYWYMRGMWTVQFFHIIAQGCATFTSSVHKILAKNLLKEGFGTIIIDSWYWQISVELLELEDGMRCAVHQLRMNFSFRLHEKDIFRPRL